MTVDPWLFMVAVLSDAAATRVLIETVIGSSRTGRVFRSEPATDADPGLAAYTAAPVWKALAAEYALQEIEETRN